MLIPDSKILHGISPEAWEHPADKAALSALRNIPGFAEITKALFSVTTEKSLRLLHLATSVRTTPSQYPDIHSLIRKAAAVLDYDFVPEVFVTRSPLLNAGVYGVKEPFIVVNTELTEKLERDGIFLVLAHEMGHIISGHALYKTLLWLMLNISFKLLPVSDIAIYPVVAALKEWDRKSELSADRAALLAVQKENISYSVLMKMAGGNSPEEISISDFISQAQEYEDSRDVADGFYKLLNTVWTSHPFPVVRLKELKSWIDSGSFNRILKGEYPQRDENSSSSTENINEAFKYYRKTADRETEPLREAAEKISSNITRLGEDLSRVMKDIFKDQ